MDGLKKDQRFLLDGQVWRVLHVNESRAHCVCEKKEVVTIEEQGKTRTFQATSRRTIDISPNSLVEVL